MMASRRSGKLENRANVASWAADPGGSSSSTWAGGLGGEESLGSESGLGLGLGFAVVRHDKKVVDDWAGAAHRRFKYTHDSMHSRVLLTVPTRAPVPQAVMFWPCKYALQNAIMQHPGASAIRSTSGRTLSAA